MGRGLGRVGGVWGFPGRQTGSRRSPKGVLCGDGLGCTEPQGLLKRTVESGSPDRSFERKPNLARSRAFHGVEGESGVRNA